MHASDALVVESTRMRIVSFGLRRSPLGLITGHVSDFPSPSRSSFIAVDASGVPPVPAYGSLHALGKILNFFRVLLSGSARIRVDFKDVTDSGSRIDRLEGLLGVV